MVARAISSPVLALFARKPLSSLFPGRFIVGVLWVFRFQLVPGMYGSGLFSQPLVGTKLFSDLSLALEGGMSILVLLLGAEVIRYEGLI